MPPRPDVRKERRGQILDAAEKVFASKGFAKARMDDIVDEAGLSKGALYWYFKSKDAIIRALLDRMFVGEMREAESLVKAQGTASDRLKSFMRLALQEIARLKPLLPLGYEFVALAARRKSVRKALAGYYHRYHGLLVTIIRQGIECGEFAELDPNQAALSMIALGEGLALVWFVDPVWVNLEALGDGPMNVLLDGFRKRNER